MKNLILASTSTLYGESFLEYLHPVLSNHFQGVSEILFVPFARPGGVDHESYCNIVREAFAVIGIGVKGLHSVSNMKQEILRAQAIYIGGGNTFVLLDQLHSLGLLTPIRESVLDGTPYLGSSAGSNVACPTVKTTNDMPIVHPVSLEALNLVPFNINPHYLDPDPGSKHKGETRETRIKEFHAYNRETVIGLREGSWITVKNDEMFLKGKVSARVFKPNQQAFEVDPETDLKLV